MVSFSFLNTIETSHFGLNSVNIRRAESVIVVSMNHPEEIHTHHTSSGKLFWNLDIGLQCRKLRTNGVFLYWFSNARLVTSPHLKLAAAAHCIQKNKIENKESIKLAGSHY